MIAVAASLFAAVVVAPHAQAGRHAKGCSPGGSATAVSWARHRNMLALVDSVLLGGAPALKSAMPCWHITIRGRPDPHRRCGILVFANPIQLADRFQVSPGAARLEIERLGAFTCVSLQQRDAPRSEAASAGRRGIVR